MSEILVLLKRNFANHVTGHHYKRSASGTLMPAEYGERNEDGKLIRLPSDAKVLDEHVELTEQEEKAKAEEIQAKAPMEPVALSELTPTQKSKSGVSVPVSSGNKK